MVWAELGNIDDETAVIQPEYEVATKDDWLGTDWEKLGNEGKGLLETTEHEFS